jgi:hypothetical protein
MAVWREDLPADFVGSGLEGRTLGGQGVGGVLFVDDQIGDGIVGMQELEFERAASMRTLNLSLRGTSGPATELFAAGEVFSGWRGRGLCGRQ